VGVVRMTEVRVAPEVGGQLAAIKVQKGERVHAGDVVAELFALELTASVGQARAALAAASANRDNVYAGVRDEEIAGQLTYLPSVSCNGDRNSSVPKRCRTSLRLVPAVLQACRIKLAGR
jgi:multidrug efflux pump subunit AcrA (membrane-fusion protein)